MKKTLALSIIIYLFVFCNPVYANPRAGAFTIGMKQYQNPTQYIFEYHNIWNTSDEAEIEHNEEMPDDLYGGEYNLSDAERLYLKKCVQAECGYDQPDEGVRMVVDVILNRIRSSKFPNDMCSVIQQPYHFSTYWNGSIDKVTDISDQVNGIVEYELQNGSSYPGLLYFTAGYYNPYCTPWKQVEDHYFGY